MSLLHETLMLYLINNSSTRCYNSPAFNNNTLAMDTITLTQPDDWHCHLRNGIPLRNTVASQSQHFARSIVMPNLVPPITNSEMATNYRASILAALPEGRRFTPLMTLFLSQAVDPEDLRLAHQQGLITACKFYPKGATTHSNAGANQLAELRDVLSVMQNEQIPLLVHAESIEAEVDIFDREARFLDTELSWVLSHFPKLKVVIEHVSTRRAVEFVQQGPAQLGATITPQHALLNRNDLLVGGIKPHYYCLPILKTRDDQAAVASAATSGHPRFFLGTDSAPHRLQDKQSACGCAGIYSAPVAMACYALLFEQYHALDKLEAFASFNGADFYGLARNQKTITLVRQEWTVPETLAYGDATIVPFFAGQQLSWQVKND